MIGDGVYYNLQGCSSVAFLCYLAGAAGDTYTLTSAQDAGGTGAAVLATITEFYTSDGVGGLWTRRTQAAGSTMITTAVTAQNAAVLEVTGTALPDGHKFLKLASTGAGLVTVIGTDLVVQRRPDRLPVVNA